MRQKGGQKCRRLELRRMLSVNLSADINVMIIAYESTFLISLSRELTTLDYILFREE